MIAVQTISTNKLVVNPFRNQLMMYWMHSINSIAKHYDTILITDIKGERLAKKYGMPYKKIYTYLDTLSTKDIKALQSFVKLYYVDKLNEDLIQFDWDVFIYEPIKNFESFIFQSNEGVCYGCFDFNYLNIKLPYDSNINSINTGTFGAKQSKMSIFKEYKKFVLEHIDTLKVLLPTQSIPHLIYDATSFVEETYIIKLCDKYSLKYDVVIERDYAKVQKHRFFSTPDKRLNYSGEYDNTTFDLQDKRYKYYHLIGEHKNSLINADKANVRFMDEFPESYEKTVALLQKERWV
jgi:hypothetical protein